MAYGQAQDPSPPQPLHRDASIIPATDDWPFLYMRAPELPRHYLSALGIVLVVSAFAVIAVGSRLRPTLPTATRTGPPSRVVFGAYPTLHLFLLRPGLLALPHQY